MSDIYSSIINTLGSWQEPPHCRAVMLEVMRVLAGFESSWNWNEGVDTTNPSSDTPETMEAGAWQVSTNSMNFGQELKDYVGTLSFTDRPPQFLVVYNASEPRLSQWLGAGNNACYNRRY